MVTTQLRTVRKNLSIRKNGATSRPWRVTCFDCPRRRDRLHFTQFGAVVVNDGGVGNRTFPLALLAAQAHLKAHANGDYS